MSPRVFRPSRRELLAGFALATTAAGCDSARPHAGYLGAMERWNRRAQSALFDPDRLAPEVPESALTPEAAFPKYKISDAFPAAPAGWRLKIGGQVKTPVELDLEALMKLPRTEYRIRHHCVEGWSAVASWAGVAVRELAERVGADPSARFVEFRSFDSAYWSSWDRPSALHRQTILAYAMNGHPLGPEHGAPLRLYSAVKLGYKMVKYLTEVNFLDAPTGGYWENQGYEWFAGV